MKPRSLEDEMVFGRTKARWKMVVPKKTMKSLEEDVERLGGRVEELEVALRDIRSKCRSEGVHYLAKILDIHETTGKALERTVLLDIRTGVAK
jgi:hypothetical protein